MENKQKIKYNKFGWVDLSELEYNKNGTTNWKASVGKKIHFKYQDIESDIVLLEYVSVHYMKIYVIGYIDEYIINTDLIFRGALGRVVKKRTSEFKHQVGECINNMLILDKYKDKRNHKYYKFRCLKDGYIGNIKESHMDAGHGCPVCASKIILVGYNDIATTRPDIVSLFLNPSDAYKYMEHSNKKTYFKCPRCGNIIYACINDVSERGLSCKKCGDGISYPNKFVYNFIEQVSKLYNGKLKFKPEKRFEWSTNYQHKNANLSGDKIYDMYIYEYNIIIENHGSYHYYKDKFNLIDKARSFDEVQENDIIKINLALSNGIPKDRYIVLNCSKSEMNHIKDSIMSSNLPQLLNFTENQIDWVQCDRFATSSRVFEACDLWNNGLRTTLGIANKMKLDRHTILKYLRRGEELGILQDPPKRLLKS